MMLAALWAVLPHALDQSGHLAAGGQHPGVAASSTGRGGCAAGEHERAWQLAERAEAVAHSITDADQRVQALAAVAGAAAAGPDLRELTGAGLVAIEDALYTVAGRTLARRTAQWDPATGPEVYLLGHEELQQAAIGYLGPAQLAGIVAACMPGPTLIAVPAHDRRQKSAPDLGRKVGSSVRGAKGRRV